LAILYHSRALKQYDDYRFTVCTKAQFEGAEDAAGRFPGTVRQRLLRAECPQANAGGPDSGITQEPAKATHAAPQTHRRGAASMHRTEPP